MIKKIALFGASGKTGSEFLKVALADGLEVRALARTPAKIPQEDLKLEVIKGDVLNFEDVLSTVKETDVVVSLFGQVKGSPKNLQTNGTKNIVKAMKLEGIDRIISLSGGGLPFPEKDHPKFPDKMIKFIMKMAVPHVLQDAEDHADVLKDSGLNWTIIRGPRLTEEPRKGHYRVGWVGVNASTKIGRADLADFILSELKKEQFTYQMPFVSY
jgi:putative NADH-flavin reductase